jgi:uridine kinase
MMVCASGSDLVALTVGILASQAVGNDRPLVVGVAGYPYTGKTHVSQGIADAWPGRAVILPTESTVHPRQWRRDHGVDGCAEAGHDVDRLHQMVLALAGGNAVTVDAYSWTVGSHVSRSRVEGVGARDLLVVDGTIAGSGRIAELCDWLIVLAPAEMTTWLGRAVERDMRERAWPREYAMAENVKKYHTSRTMCQLIPRSGTSVHVVVDPTTWRVRLPGCGFCAAKSSNGGAQSAVPELVCEFGQ